MKLRCKLSILKLTNKVILLRDDDGPVSVTNDAEAVIYYLKHQLSTKPRILYIDSMGQIDELCYTSDGKFSHFNILEENETLDLLRDD